MAIRYAICIGFLAVASINGASGREKDMFGYFDKNKDGTLNLAEHNNYEEFKEWRLKNGRKNIYYFFDKNNDGSVDRNEYQQYIEFTEWKQMNTTANEPHSVEQVNVPVVQSNITRTEESIYFEGSGASNNNDANTGAANTATNGQQHDTLTHYDSYQASNDQGLYTIPVVEKVIAAGKNLLNSITTIQDKLFGPIFENIETEIGSLNGHIGGLEQGVKTEVKTALVGLSQAQVSMTKTKRILLASAKDVIDRIDSLKTYANLLTDDDIYEDEDSVKTVVEVYIDDFISLQKTVLGRMKEGQSAYQHAMDFLSESNTYIKEFAGKMEYIHRVHGHNRYINNLISMVRNGCNNGIVGGRIGLAICYGIRGNRYENLRSEMTKFEGKVDELVDRCGRAARKTSNLLQTSKKSIKEISDEQISMQTSISEVVSALKGEKRNSSIAFAMHNSKTLLKKELKNSKKEIFKGLNALTNRMQAFINSNRA